MTKREREQLQKAVRLIHVEDCYYEGMGILCRLCGLTIPAVEAESTVATIGLREIYNQPPLQAYSCSECKRTVFLSDDVAAAVDYKPVCDECGR
jgi:hypothetical protein